MPILAIDGVVDPNLFLCAERCLSFLHLGDHFHGADRYRLKAGVASSMACTSARDWFQATTLSTDHVSIIPRRRNARRKPNAKKEFRAGFLRIKDLEGQQGGDGFDASYEASPPDRIL